MIKLEEYSTDYVTRVFDEESNILFSIKWDGCIDIWRGMNGADVVGIVLEGKRDKHNDLGYIHICDPNGIISNVQQLSSFKPKKADW